MFIFFLVSPDQSLANELKAAALLQELSEACSKEGGSKALEAELAESPGGGGSGGGSGLLVDAKRATETAVTRYTNVMLTRPRYDGIGHELLHV